MMKKTHHSLKLPALLLICVLFLTHTLCVAHAYENSTLYNGCRGEEVRELQQALIDLGYLGGTADGIFGKNTENAVRKFQKKNKLTVDGLAGSVTRSLILSKSSGKKSASANSAAVSPAPVAEQNSSQSVQTERSTAVQSDSSSLFAGNYTTLRLGNRGDRVRLLQNALISLGFLKGKADGVFGNMTLAAVKAFQTSNKLTADGIAGRRTLSALENVVKNGNVSSSGSEQESASVSTVSSEKKTETAAETDNEDINEKISGPSSGSVQLLHWFNDIKSSLSNGQNLLVYDPSTGLSWTLRILSRGRHCDAEPLTSRDTRTMVKAFGGVNTWNQKAVYVRLPDGTWTLGSTHDMPHQSGSIKNNDFNGHLCVHFLRDMDEARQNDPNYGVSNQETIRAWWKKLTGQEITN